MTCANWLLTVCSALILFVTLSSTTFSMNTNKWVVIIASVVILIVAWTIVECKPRKSKIKAKKKK